MRGDLDRSNLAGDLIRLREDISVVGKINQQGADTGQPLNDRQECERYGWYDWTSATIHIIIVTLSAEIFSEATH